MAEPTRLRRQLGAELRAARTLADRTQYDLAAAVEVSQATVVRIEQGRALLPREGVTRWLDACAAADDVRERVLVLTATAHSETWSWDEPLGGGVSHLQGIAQDRDANARLVRSYHHEWIPGLLQTAAYARNLLPLVDATGRMDHAAAAAARMSGQQVLYQPGHRFEFLIAENALRWSPGEGVMVGQRGHLMALAGLESVEMRILPARRIGAPGWNGFVLRTPKDGEMYVTTELLHGGQVITDPDSVALYEALWQQLWEAAVVGDDAVELIRRIG